MKEGAFRLSSSSETRVQSWQQRRMKSQFTLFCFPTWPVMMDEAKRTAWNKTSITKNDAGNDNLKRFDRCSASGVMAFCQSFLSGWKATMRTPEITIVLGLGTCLARFNPCCQSSKPTVRAWPKVSVPRQMRTAQSRENCAHCKTAS